MVAASLPLLPLGKSFHGYAIDAHLLDVCRAPLQAYAGRREDGRAVRLYCQETIEASPGSAEDFWRHLERLQRVVHERIPQILDGGLDEDLAWIAVSAIEGESLWEAILGGAPLNPMHLVMMLRDAVAALRVARDVGVLHGRLTPRHLLTSAAECRGVLEVGFSRLFGASDDGPYIVFRSPEQLDSLGEVDERADIYALGAIGYFALGASPFEDPVGAYDQEQLRRRILVEELPPLSSIRPDCPPAVDNLLRSMCAKLRDDRPRTFEDLDKMLESVLAVCVARRKGQEPERVDSPADDVRALVVTAPLPVLRAPDPEPETKAPELEDAHPGNQRSAAPEPEPPAPNDTQPAPTRSAGEGNRPELRVMALTVWALGSVAILTVLGAILLVLRVEARPTWVIEQPMPALSSTIPPMAFAPSTPGPAPPPHAPPVEVRLERPASKPVRAPVPRPTAEPVSSRGEAIQERVNRTRYPLKEP